MLSGEMLFNLNCLSNTICLSHQPLLFLLTKTDMFIFSQKVGRFSGKVVIGGLDQVGCPSVGLQNHCLWIQSIRATSPSLQPGQSFMSHVGRLRPREKWLVYSYMACCAYPHIDYSPPHLIDSTCPKSSSSRR